nr:hypothetical protein BaRGS_014308 [Batillaria attramentaria]
MPKFNATDTLYVYSLKAPILELQLGDRLAKYVRPFPFSQNVLHDAIGFHHVQSGLNFTLEWHAIGQLLNGTFPHELDNQSLVWCNQGAACVSDGIDEKRWNADSTPVKVAELNGTTFNLFANWTEMDNNTNVFYQTWTVREEPGGKMWFDSCDASLWVQRAFAAMAESGASFNHSVHLNYTKIYLYSKTAPSGANFTMEWSGLGDIFNCTFPHELNNGTLVWCNQAATCISNGIDEKHWREEGMLVKVAEINVYFISI